MAGNKTQATFDKYASDYDRVQSQSMGVLGKDVEKFARYKVELVKEFLPETPQKILEFGCGTGRNLQYFRQFFRESEIWGCDISEDSLKIASERAPDVHLFSSENIAVFSDYQDKFDLLFLAGVLHHIRHDEHETWINAVGGTLKKHGYLIIFEHNPHNPITRHLVNSCPYDADAELLKLSNCKKILKKCGLAIKKTGYTLLFPWRLPFLLKIEKSLEYFPFGGQYYVMAEKMNRSEI